MTLLCVHRSVQNRACNGMRVTTSQVPAPAVAPAFADKNTVRLSIKGFCPKGGCTTTSYPSSYSYPPEAMYRNPTVLTTQEQRCSGTTWRCSVVRQRHGHENDSWSLGITRSSRPYLPT